MTSGVMLIGYGGRIETFNPVLVGARVERRSASQGVEALWIRGVGQLRRPTLWLPAGIAAQAAVRFPVVSSGPDGDPHFWPAVLTAAGSLVLVAPCGLPLALGCRRLWRLHYRRAAWAAGIGLGAVTVAASLVAGLRRLGRAGAPAAATARCSDRLRLRSMRLCSACGYGRPGGSWCDAINLSL